MKDPEALIKAKMEAQKKLIAEYNILGAQIEEIAQKRNLIYQNMMHLEGAIKALRELIEKPENGE